MSAEESKPETPTTSQSVEWVIPEGGASEFYSDWYHINWLPLNVRIRFGQIVADKRVGPSKGEGWTIDERAALTMPWATVKGLTEYLSKLVAAYENKNGEIKIPAMPDGL